MAMSYAHTYCRRISAITRPKRPGAATCLSCSVDARLMRRAACIGMGGLSVSRPSLMNTTPLLCDTALRTNKRVVLNTTDSNRVVRDTFVRINSAPARPYNASLSPTRYSGRGCWQYDAAVRGHALD